jgi:hypothetical protein
VNRAPTEGAHVTLHVWRVKGRRLPRVLWRMARDARRLRATPGVRFAKLLGTGRGFGAGRPDPGRWAAIVSWDDAAAAAGFDDTATARSWRALADGYCRIDLSPVASRGRWAGQTPFPVRPTALDPAATVLALTRARLRLRTAASFWRAIGPVAATARTAPGLLAALGIGEAPFGWQGTVSVWRTSGDLVEFAYRQADHQRVIAETPVRGWYAEELFARFAVLSVVGDRAVLAWAEEDATQDPAKADETDTEETQ